MTDREQTRGFLRQMIRIQQLRDADDIFALGFVNSLFAMQLIAWIERTFEVKVEDEDLEIANFNSVDAIANFVGRKRASRPAATHA